MCGDDRGKKKYIFFFIPDLLELKDLVKDIADIEPNPIRLSKMKRGLKTLLLLVLCKYYNSLSA